MITELDFKRYQELKARNPDMSEITGPLLAREHEKDIRMDFARKILSGEYKIESAFQGWEGGQFKYETSTKNGNVSWGTNVFKGGDYVILLVKKEKE